MTNSGAKNGIVIILALLILISILIQTGVAYTLSSTSGKWTSVTGPVYHGVGTNHIYWGTGSPSSGAIFNGVGITSFPNINDVFKIGELTHENYPISSGTGATGATLQITLTFSNPALPPIALTYNLVIEDTPNKAKCKDCDHQDYTPCYDSGTPCSGFSGPCPDRLEWSNTQATQSFLIGDTWYTLVIDGFKSPCVGGTTINRFITQEGCTNTACLYGHLIKAVTAIEVVKKTNGQIIALAPGPTIPVNCPVNWQYFVTNRGENALSSVTVTDSQPGVTVSCSGTTLAVGASMTCTASGTAISGQYQNTASVSGRDSANHLATDTDTSYYFGCTPLLTITPASPAACEGSEITLTAAITGCSALTGESYQWYKGSAALGDNTKYSGTTAKNLLIKNLVLGDAGDYSVTVTFYGGCTGTAATTLAVQAKSIVSAGPGQTVCDNVGNVPLTGTNTAGPATYVWTTSGTLNTISNPTSLTTAYYTPSTSDIAAGSVTITLTSTDTSPCSETSVDTMLITIRKNPVASAGPDQTVCENVGTVSLTGINTGGPATYAWTTSGTPNTISNPTSLTTAYYNPSASDISAGSVTITLTATGTSPCSGTSVDTMRITIRKNPVASAGPDQSFCNNVETVSLTGTNTGYSPATYEWTSSGTGTFSDPTALITTYTPSPADIDNGLITITLTANTGCSYQSVDQMQIVIWKTPIIAVTATIT